MNENIFEALNAQFTKNRILKKGDITRFLVYSPSGKPTDEDNWLLDLILIRKNYFFHACS